MLHLELLWSKKIRGFVVIAYRQEETCQTLKRCVAEAPILSLQDFNRVFEVECHVSGLALTNTYQHPMTYNREMFNEEKKKYCILIRNYSES